MLDRTKEPGSAGEPLYLDVVAALHESSEIAVLADATSYRRISSADAMGCGHRKNLHPRWSKACLTKCARMSQKQHFTIGITDDVTHTSLPADPTFTLARDRRQSSVSSGVWVRMARWGRIKTRSRSSAKRPKMHAQGYFVYDSKKSGSVTISHLRFGPQSYSRTLSDRQRASRFRRLPPVYTPRTLRCTQICRPDGVFLLDSLYPPEKYGHICHSEVQQDNYRETPARLRD